MPRIRRRIAQRDKGSLGLNHFDDRHFIRSLLPSPSSRSSLAPVGSYFTCTLDIDFVIRGSSESIGPRGEFAIGGEMRGGWEETRQSKRGVYATDRQTSQWHKFRRYARAFLRPKKSRAPRVIRGNGREMKIFIPAVEKRSTMLNYAGHFSLTGGPHAVAAAIFLSLSLSRFFPPTSFGSLHLSLIPIARLFPSFHTFLPSPILFFSPLVPTAICTPPQSAPLVREA